MILTFGTQQELVDFVKSVAEKDDLICFYGQTRINDIPTYIVNIFRDKKNAEANELVPG